MVIVPELGEKRRWAPLAARVAALEPFAVAAAGPAMLFSTRFAPFAAAVLLLFWPARLVADGRLTRPAPLNRPMLGLLIMACVSLYPSVDLSLSLPKFWSLLFAIAVYFAVINVRRPDAVIARATRIVPLVVVGVDALALVGTSWPSGKGFVPAAVYQHLPSLIARLPQSALAAQTQARGWQANEVAGTLNLIVPVAAALALWGHGNRARANAIAAALGLGVLALTQSRSGYAAAVVSAIALAGLRWSGRSVGVAVVGIALIGAAAFAVTATANPRVATFVITQRASLASDAAGRFELWDRAWAMIQDFPYTGIGLNTFPVVAPLLYPTFREDASQIPHAHDLFLQTAVDFGLPGLGAFLALLWGTLRCLRFTWRRGDDLARGLAAGIGCGVLGFLAFGLADAVALGARPTALLFGLLGVLVALTHRLLEGNPRRLGVVLPGEAAPQASQ